MAAYLAPAGFTAAFHPIGYAKVLMQLGHEPLDPYLRKTWFGFGKAKYCYPSVFKYVGHIYKTDGFFGLYRGLGPRILGGFVGNYVDKFVFKELKDYGTSKNEETAENKDELIVWVKTFFRATSIEVAAKCCGIVVSQPLNVIMIRQMAQFVGGETEYNSVFSSVAEIYRNDGILGFFAGLIPRLIGEIVAVFLSNFIAQLFNKYFVEDKELQQYCTAGWGVFLSQFTYPFQLVSNVMAVCNSGLVVSRYPYMSSYTSWTECWRDLRSKDSLSRGNTIFWRYLKKDPISSSVYVAKY